MAGGGNVQHVGINGLVLIAQLQPHHNPALVVLARQPAMKSLMPQSFPVRLRFQRRSQQIHVFVKNINQFVSHSLKSSVIKYHIMTSS